MLDAPYPTAFARRVGEKCLDSLLLDVRGEPVLVRIVPEHTPLPALTRPDEFQAEWEAAGSISSDALAQVLSDAP